MPAARPHACHVLVRGGLSACLQPEQSQQSPLAPAPALSACQQTAWRPCRRPGHCHCHCHQRCLLPEMPAQPPGLPAAAALPACLSDRLGRGFCWACRRCWSSFWRFRVFRCMSMSMRTAVLATTCWGAAQRSGQAMGNPLCNQPRAAVEVCMPAQMHFPGQVTCSLPYRDALLLSGLHPCSGC